MATSKSYYRKFIFAFCVFTLPLSFSILPGKGRAAASLKLPGDFEMRITAQIDSARGAESGPAFYHTEAELGHVFTLSGNTLLRPFASYELLSVQQENLLDGYGALSSQTPDCPQSSGRVKIGAGAAWQDGHLFLGGKIYLAESLDGDEEAPAAGPGHEFGNGRAMGASLQGGFILNERFSVSAGLGAEQNDNDLAKEARLRFELKF